MFDVVPKHLIPWDAVERTSCFVEVTNACRLGQDLRGRANSSQSLISMAHKANAQPRDVSTYTLRESVIIYLRIFLEDPLGSSIVSCGNPVGSGQVRDHPLSNHWGSNRLVSCLAMDGVMRICKRVTTLLISRMRMQIPT